MPETYTEYLGFGITCIDAHYLRPGLACFYLLEQGDEYALIETGTVHSVPFLEQVLAQRGVSPEQVRYVIPTHVHLDHAGGAGLMMARFPEAQLLVHPRGARHMIDPERLIAGSQAVYGDELFAQLYGEIVPIAANRVVEVDDGAVFRLGDRPLLFRNTRGHAEHHFCIWDEVSRGWFSGDMFGISYRWFRTPGGDFAMPATTPTQFNPEEYQRSLALLTAQRPERIFLTHYGQLGYSDAVKELLSDQVSVYTELATGAMGDVAALEATILGDAMARVEAMNPGADMSAMYEYLRHDANLNAQGLAVWYQRHSG